MKRRILTLVAALAVLAGCQQDGFIDMPSVVNDDLHASVEDMQSSTKTVLDENNNVLWSENDQLMAFMKSSLGLRYEIAQGSAGKTYARFVKVPGPVSDDLYAGMAWDHNVVLYPYSADIECERMEAGHYNINMTLPAEQTYVPGSFANGAFPMVAVSEDNDITFKNIVGAMKLQLTGSAKIVSIKIEGRNNEILAGPAMVTAYPDGSYPEIEMSSAGSTSVTLNCGAGIQLSSDVTEIIIALPPVVFTKGFIVTFIDAAGNDYYLDTDKVNEVKRSSLLVMPEKELGIAIPKPNDGDYFDEYNINHGQGIRIGDVVWAPVNCGYRAPVADEEGNITDKGFPYGKLYQWGRKYGQGYSDGVYEDAVVPKVVKGTVSLEVGQDPQNEAVFYSKNVAFYDWVENDQRSEYMWNKGTSSSPIKTEYDPCPAGWRVPTISELNALNKNKSGLVTNESGQVGIWFTGPVAYSESASRIFLPFAGETKNSDGSHTNRNSKGRYWSSGYYPDSSDGAAYLLIQSSTCDIYKGYRANGYSVRCVLE